MYKQALALLLLIAPPTSLFAEDLRVCDSLGDKGIETLQWSLGIIDQKLPKVPPMASHRPTSSEICAPQGNGGFTLLSSASRNDLLSRSGGYVALLGSYARCKLNGVLTGQKPSMGTH